MIFQFLRQSILLLGAGSKAWVAFFETPHAVHIPVMSYPKKRQQALPFHFLYADRFQCPEQISQK